MTPEAYRAALATLGLSQQAAGRWLGVSRKTAQNYATVGPSAPAAKAIQGEIENRALRETIDQLGDIADVCVFGSIGRVCSYCRCDRVENTG